MPPLVTRPKAATVGVGRQVILRPAVQKRCVTLPEPTLADQRTDLERLRDALPDLELRVDLPAVRDLARALRAIGGAADRAVTAVVVDDVLVDVEPGDTSGRLFGIAFDLGTTTVVATLLDLATGTPAAVASLLNPQQPYGADVITRISATMMDPDALGRLTALAHQGLDQLAGEVCADAGVERREVYEIALAGNATMVHLALGLDPEPLGVAPVRHGVPVVRRSRSPPTSASPSTRGPGRTCSPRSAPTSAATSSRARSRRGWTATGGSGCSSTSARTARSSSPPATACSRRPRPPGRRSRARPSAAGCAPPRARSRA